MLKYVEVRFKEGDILILMQSDKCLSHFAVFCGVGPAMDLG